ncbi:MAG TPA: hypothetical protein PLG22_07305 [Kiritimatiellia bacterium]|nr:hypothetical protein [Kiritimatiellia bacterium]
MKTKTMSVDGKKETPLGRDEITLLRGTLIIGGTNLRRWLGGHGDVSNGYNALVGRRTGRKANHIRSKAREMLVRSV